MYAHKGGTKKLKRHGLHGFALDQPSINGIGPINRSETNETVGNGRKRTETSRKRSETVGNMIRPNLVQPAFLLNKHFRAKPFFFFEGPKVSKGKRLETVRDRTFARQKRHVFTHFSNIFHEHMLQNNYFFAERRCDLRLFPTVSLGHLWTFKKKTALRGNAYHPKENAGWTRFGLIMFPTVSDRFRLFPTVSFFLND